MNSLNDDLTLLKLRELYNELLKASLINFYEYNLFFIIL